METKFTITIEMSLPDLKELFSGQLGVTPMEVTKADIQIWIQERIAQEINFLIEDQQT